MPDIRQETTIHFADHEVLLSFVNDADAVQFEEWWNDEGVHRFLAVKQNYGS